MLVKHNVAFSRVKTLQGLHILIFNASAIKKSDAVEEEMARLNDKLLPPLPHCNVVHCLTVMSPYHRLMSDQLMQKCLTYCVMIT